MTCLVQDCTTEKREGGEFCEFHSASAEEIGRMRNQLEVYQKLIDRLMRLLELMVLELGHKMKGSQA